MACLRLARVASQSQVKHPDAWVNRGRSEGVSRPASILRVAETGARSRPVRPRCDGSHHVRRDAFRVFFSFSGAGQGLSGRQGNHDLPRWNEARAPAPQELLLLLLVATKTAAQHSCHMLQVRDFKGTLLGIGSKVWRDVSSWTSCRCGTQVLVGLFLVF